MFFAVSGMWQTFRLQDAKDGSAATATLKMLSTVHVAAGQKMAGTWSSEPMKWFVVLASLAFILTMVLGIMMAFKFGRTVPAVISLAVGIVIPIALVLLFASSPP